MKARTYDKEFKLNALSLYNGGKSARQVCKDLGIPESTFSGWIKQHATGGEKDFTGSGNVRFSNQEMHALKKELEDVRTERDILKKALAIFSKQK
jgi:transposase-like protein